MVTYQTAVPTPVMMQQSPAVVATATPERPASSTSASTAAATRTTTTAATTATAAAAPTPTPPPPRHERSPGRSPPPDSTDEDDKGKHSCKPRWPQDAKLLLEVRDLRNDGAQSFLDAIDNGFVLAEFVRLVLRLLYDPAGGDAMAMPGTRSVTFVVRPFAGVAYTTGRDIDDDHKEIHVSTDYIEKKKKKKKKKKKASPVTKTMTTTKTANAKETVEPRSNHDRDQDHSQDDRHHLSREIRGVVLHELVHCFQWDAQGTCPWGLCEGIADWVRLSGGLGARHWKRQVDCAWDSGYERTAYFLDYLEDRFGYGTVAKINASLGRDNDVYDEAVFWPRLFAGLSVRALWHQYCIWVRESCPGEDQGAFTSNDHDRWGSLAVGPDCS